MGRKERILKAVVGEAIDAVCQSGGVHPAVCPIARALVQLRFGEVDEDSEGRQAVPVGDRVRARAPSRPEAVRDVFTELVPEGKDIQLPFPIPFLVAPEILRRTIAKGMVQHVIRGARGAPVGAGGRTVQDIVTRLRTGQGIRRLKKGSGGDVGFVPGESGF